MSNLKFDAGTIAVIIVVLLFYLRIAMIRGRNKKRQRQLMLKQQKSGKLVPPQDPNMPSYEITSWWLVGAAGLLMLVGLGLKTMTSIPAPYTDYWWLPLVAGGIIFIFCFK
jgi:hypothetical protein